MSKNTYEDNISFLISYLISPNQNPPEKIDFNEISNVFIPIKKEIETQRKLIASKGNKNPNYKTISPVKTMRNQNKLISENFTTTDNKNTSKCNNSINVYKNNTVKTENSISANKSTIKNDNKIKEKENIEIESEFNFSLESSGEFKFRRKTPKIDSDNIKINLKKDMLNRLISEKKTDRLNPPKFQLTKNIPIIPSSCHTFNLEDNAIDKVNGNSPYYSHFTYQCIQNKE